MATPYAPQRVPWAPEHEPYAPPRPPGFNELVRILRQGNEFLSRPQVGGVLLAKAGDTEARALRWGGFNRAVTPFNMNVSLPVIEPTWVGVPLYFAKMDHGGTTTVTIEAVGFALGSRTIRPKINDAAQYLATAARLYVFMTDGTNWFVDG